MLRAPRPPAKVNRRELDRDGYTVVSLLDGDACARAEHIVSDLGLPEDHGFFVSVAHAWGERALDLHETLRPIVAPAVRELLADHEPFLIAVTSKGRESETTIKFHQDWTYTDERDVRTLFLWCPLVDVGPENGTLHVVPGSHRWSDGVRASRSVEATEHLQEHFARLARPVHLRAGQAILFEPSTIHGSGPNHTDRRRPALTTAIAPAGSEFVHFHLDENGELTGYRVTEEFFTTNPYGTAPEGRPPFAPWAPAVSEAELRAAGDRAAEAPNRRWPLARRRRRKSAGRRDNTSG